MIQADRDNPDPSQLSPVLIIGCDGLKKQFDELTSNTERLKGYASDQKEQLLTLERALDRSTSRLEELVLRQAKYQLRLLQVMRKLEVLRTKGLPLSAIEVR